MNAEVVAHLAYGALRALASASWRQDASDEVFVRRYADDGLRPFDQPARQLATRIQGCLGCGACELLSCSPRALLLSGRGLTDLDAARPLLDRIRKMDPGKLRDLQRGCPASIPFQDLGRLYDSLDPHA